MKAITVRANAKINLGLDVLRRREDGYHEVKMIMQTVGISDTLTFALSDTPGVTLTIDKQELPADGSNLIVRAVSLMQERFRLDGGLEISVQKRIPIAAGMAGGSADAAAAIHAVDRIYGLGLSLTQKQALGVKLGADVPYCLMGGTALSEGIGEVLTALPEMPAAHLVIAKPAIDVSTRFVYENLHVETLSRHPDIDGMAESIRRRDLEGVVRRMENVLETVTAARYPIIGQTKAFLMENGAMGALMSGSGPTVFGVFEREETARRAYEAMQDSAFQAQVFLTGFTGQEMGHERIWE